MRALVSNDVVVAQLQREVEELKKVYREAVWSKAAIFGPPRRRPNSPELFVLMPFGTLVDPIYRQHIRRVASRVKMKVARADDFFGSVSIMNDIWSAINTARVVVADCTGKNANVFYEIGLAHAIGIRTVLISQSLADVPFDLRHLRIIIYKYTPLGMKKFESELLKTLVDIN